MPAVDIGAAYDARSGEYVERFGSVDTLLPADRDFVSRWRDTTTGRLLDAGCGPGPWVEVLGEAGRDVVGLDLSAQFLTVARRHRPAVPFLQASMAALPLRAGTVGGVLAWYSVIHTPPDALPALIGEISRVLVPGGGLALAFVDGEPGVEFDHSVAPAYFWSVDGLRPLLAGAGFEVVDQQRRQDPRVRPHAALLARRRAGEAGVGST